MIAARGKKCCTLYKASVSVCKSGLNAAEDSATDVWHRRLGHMSEKGLQLLAKKQLLLNVTGIPLKTCIDCLSGKQHRVSFVKTASHTNKVHALDLVYSDVCGPMRTKTLGGALYFVTFIDDASRRVWVYALKSKDEVFGVFKLFHAMVERETGRSLKCIRTDNGGEYIGDFHEYCKSLGKRHEQSVPKTPQHNGVAERMNRTIVERIRCMLSHAKLPKMFWGEAMHTAVYLINRSPSAPLNGEVPENV